MAPRKSCLPMVDQGCCCDLKTCCKVQGWLLLIGSSLSIIAAIIDLASISSVCSYAAYHGVDCNANGRVRSQVAAAYALCGINIVLQAIFLVTATLFLIGIAKDQPGKMVHYIRLLWVEIVFSSISIIVGAALVTPVYLVAFVVMALPVYCLICANSLHIKMEEEQGGRNMHQSV